MMSCSAPCNSFHAFDDHAARARAFDFRAHLVQKIRQVDDFRLLRCAFDHGGAFGQNRRHHDVVGAQHSRAKFSAQIDDRAIQFRRENFHVAAFYPHGCAERLETFQMQIDRPIADNAPPGIETVASLHRPRSGPRTQTDARIFRTTSYGATE